MIIGANKRGNGGQLAAYLLNQEKNERAELVEMRGFADTGNLKGALNGIELEAMQTNGTKPFYHCWLRLDDGESLTAAQWQKSFEAVERRLHLEDQARVIVEHQLQGEKHYAVVWSLVDRERGLMIEFPFDGMRRAEVARTLEQEFGLRKLAPAHEPEQERLLREEWQQAERALRDVAEVRNAKAAIRDAWQRSDNGGAFCAALEEKGLMLAIGDSERQPFGVVDEHGQFHVLTRTLDVRAKAVRGKLADLDREQIPSVEEAHERLQGRETDREREAWEDRLAVAAIQKDQAEHQSALEARDAGRKPPEAEAKNKALGKAAGDIRLAANLSHGGEEFALFLASRGYVLARVTEQEAAGLERAAAYAKEIGHHAPHYRAGELVVVNSFGGIHRLTERNTGKTRDELDKYLVQIQRDALPMVEQGKKTAVLRAQDQYKTGLLEKQAQQKAELERQHAERDQRAKAFEEKTRQEIDAGLACRQVLDKSRLEKRLKENHVPLLSRATERLKQFIRHRVEDHQAEQRKEKLHKTIVENGWRNVERDEVRQERLEQAHERAQDTLEIKQAEAREKMGIHAPERAEALKDARRNVAETAFGQAAAKTTEHRPRGDGWADQSPVKEDARERGRAAPDKNRDGGRFRVIDRESGLAGGVSAFAASLLDGIARPVEGIAEGLASMFDGGSTAPRVPQPEPARAPKSALQRLQERAAKERALRNISQSVERGGDVNAADLRALLPAELERLRDGGDEYLMRLVQRYERERDDRGRERER